MQVASECDAQIGQAWVTCAHLEPAQGTFKGWEWERGVSPRRIQIQFPKEGEMDKAQVKQLLSTSILNLLFPAHGFPFITWEEIPWVTLDDSMHGCVAGYTIPSTTLFSIIKHLSGVCPGFLGGHFLTGEHQCALSVMCRGCMRTWELCVWELHRPRCVCLWVGPDL